MIMKRKRKTAKTLFKTITKYKKKMSKQLNLDFLKAADIIRRPAFTLSKKSAGTSSVLEVAFSASHESK